MISVERLLPQPEVIEPLSKESVLIPHPGDLEENALKGILAESIFLTSKKVRIRATYQECLIEISPAEIEEVRTKYDNADTTIYIFDRANDLRWADEVVIETFEQ